MHEQATLAKLRRAALGRAARWGGSRALDWLTLTPAEQAALDWRKARTSGDAARKPCTTFAIPLVGAHQVGDWQVIEDTLTRTLRAFQDQSDPNWRVVICSQTRPEATGRDARISYLPFTRSVDGHDKAPKLAALAEHCLHADPRPGFFMPMDGDDLLHRDFVADLHAQPDTGLLVSSGLMLDAGTGRLARTEARSLSQPLQKPFWKFCGSCMALPTGSAPAEESAFFSALAAHEHRLYPHLAAIAGITLRRTAEPRALYVINHGENFESRRGRGGFKQRFVARFAESADAAERAIEAGFPAAEGLMRPQPAGL